MTREHLFKAKCANTGEWVMGNLIQNAVYDTAIYDCNEMEYCGVEVDEETVCEFSNQKDSKGDRIFEGDRDHDSVVRFDTTTGRWMLGDGQHSVDLAMVCGFTITGNIHDKDKS
ncbi:hypothetical protein KAR91_53615 [Candidatus Pacearchaeota archaeon]|nr:hypothetical protein [Candidatus Pacearchaeota archaeon]